jgi:hypothetical protein
LACFLITLKVAEQGDAGMEYQGVFAKGAQTWVILKSLFWCLKKKAPPN